MNTIGAYYTILVSDHERRAAERRDALRRGTAPSLLDRVATRLVALVRPRRSVTTA